MKQHGWIIDVYYKKAYILWSTHATFWKRKNHRGRNQIGSWQGLLHRKLVDLKRMHRTFQAKRILCGTGVVDTDYTYVKTHRSVNHKEWTLLGVNIEQKGIKRRINSKTESTITNEPNSITDKWHNCTQHGGGGWKENPNYGK